MTMIAKTRAAKYNSLALHFKILVDGQTLSVYGASNENFDIYIYSILKQMYQREHRMLTCYEKYFDYDWSERLNRVMALNELHALNLARVKSMRPAIPLFTEEVQ